MENQKNFGKLNIKNLKRTVELLKIIDKEKFNMSKYRDSVELLDMKHNYLLKAECNTVGCILGHATVLDPELFEKAKQRYMNTPFITFSKLFFGELNSDEWEWLFSGSWAVLDSSLQRNIMRLEWTIENGFPEESDIRDMMSLRKKLIY